jgi:cobaltochelatase CobS
LRKCSSSSLPANRFFSKVRQVAASRISLIRSRKALKLGYGALHCSAGASEAQLLGWLLPTGKGGQFEYEPAQFARMYKEGNALFLVDEIDAADANMLMVLNGALANGHLHVPQNLKEPSVERGKKFCVMAAANTFGTGADAMYVGRNQLDAATLDRFYVVEMDYDRKVELSMASKEVCEWVWNLRERTKQAKLRRVVSTRTIQRMAAGLQAGLSMQEVQADAVLSWTADEKAKVGL